ncbi:hypothetical protein IWW36_002121 [Coemansia brasiliensis]|uniref:Major facilitator superfamily (MFS) profile domain-containing protein n=1 Tax=Coemansia brasiliensis TaxID=2650707 RepID=A0A9W8M061_9FUNG|nr:hypothetical protein IWW36_002121 [Coemansia brasiliensis]
MPLSRRVIVTSALALTIFLGSFDLTVVSTIIPSIAHEFNALSNATWISTAFMLTSTAIQPLYGRLSDIFGRTTTLLSAIALFAAGSAACGWAQNMSVLIFGRALQGTGGSGLVAQALIVVSDLTTEQERAGYLAGFNLVWTLSSIIGPVLGGVFAEKASWRWAFWINLPLASLVSIVILFYLRLPVPKNSFWIKLKQVDFLGSLVLVGGVMMLLLAFTWGGKAFSWASARIICLLIFSILTLGLFLLIEWKVVTNPVVPLHLFSSRNVSLMVLSQFFVWIGMYSVIFFVPIWYAIVKNSSSINLGLHLLPFLLGISVVSIGVGLLVSKTKHYRGFILFGTILFVLGSGLIILFDEHTSSAQQICFLLIMGCGLGFIIQTMLLAMQVAVAIKHMAAATAVFMFARMLGSSVGIAVLQSIFQNEALPKLDLLSQQYPKYATDIANTFNDQSIIYTASFPLELRNQIIHYYVMALQKVFIAATCFTAIVLLLSLGVKHIPLRQ